MKRHLFLTGEIGCGKSTAIVTALGGKRQTLGGFLTCRNRDAGGHVSSFSLLSPDGKKSDIFLDFSTGSPETFLGVFETLGVPALEGEVLLLDEIGGVELLSDAFWEALMKTLQKDIPIIGVLKGKSPANALAEALGLSEEYVRRAGLLWEYLSRDAHTEIYSCGKYDEKALALAKQWVSEYCL